MHACTQWALHTQAVSYCIYMLERSRKVCKRAKLVGMDMVRVDNKLFTLPGTGKRRAQMNYITGEGAFNSESH